MSLIAIATGTQQSITCCNKTSPNFYLKLENLLIWSNFSSQSWIGGAWSYWVYNYRKETTKQESSLPSLLYIGPVLSQIKIKMQEILQMTDKQKKSDKHK